MASISSTLYFQWLHTILEKVKSIQFSKLLACYQQDIFRQKLVTCIQWRVRLELVRIKKKYPAEETFVTRALMAIKNIVTCFSGSHTNCAERSLACYAHLESFSTQLHPYGSKSGYRRPPQAEISHEQVPVYKDFELNC